MQLISDHLSNYYIHNVDASLENKCIHVFILTNTCVIITVIQFVFKVRILTKCRTVRDNSNELDKVCIAKCIDRLSPVQLLISLINFILSQFIVRLIWPQLWLSIAVFLSKRCNTINRLYSESVCVVIMIIFTNLRLPYGTIMRHILWQTSVC